MKVRAAGVRMDAAGTTIMNSGGTFDASGKMLTTSGRMDDFATGKVVTMRERMTCSSNDEVLFEMWGPGPDGKDNRMMEIRYTRKK